MDLVVVGLGAFGSAVAYHAASLGLSVVGFDRHHPPHEFGSSHAETRVTRLAVGEGPEYVPFAARAHQIWRTLETTAGVRLLHDHGGLFIAPTAESDDHRWGNFVDATEAVATDAGVGFDRLSPDEARQRFPNFLVRDGEAVGYEPTAGLVMAERAVEIQLREARQRGAVLHLGQPVLSIGRRGGHPSVRTATEEIAARNVVVCAGPWAPHLHDADRLRVTRQTVFWFEADDLEAWRPERVGFAIWAGRSIEEYLGVFASPLGSTPGVKILGEQFAVATTVSDVDRTVSPDEIAAFHETMVHPRLAGITNRCVRTAVCLYTNTSDDQFLIDRHPEHDDVTVVSACSGHGFKHSTAIGEAIARDLAGLDHLDLSAFSRQARQAF